MVAKNPNISEKPDTVTGEIFFEAKHFGLRSRHELTCAGRLTLSEAKVWISGYRRGLRGVGVPDAHTQEFWWRAGPTDPFVIL